MMIHQSPRLVGVQSSHWLTITMAHSTNKFCPKTCITYWRYQSFSFQKSKWIKLIQYCVVTQVITISLWIQAGSVYFLIRTFYSWLCWLCHETEKVKQRLWAVSSSRRSIVRIESPFIVIVRRLQEAESETDFLPISDFRKCLCCVYYNMYYFVLISKCSTLRLFWSLAPRHKPVSQKIVIYM